MQDKKKEKKNIKVGDLKPKKDAKGGGGRAAGGFGTKGDHGTTGGTGTKGHTGTQ